MSNPAQFWSQWMTQSTSSFSPFTPSFLFPSLSWQTMWLKYWVNTNEPFLDWLQQQLETEDFKKFDPIGIQKSCLKTQLAWLKHPQELTHWISELSQDLQLLHLQSLQRLMGIPVEDRVKAVEYDERFQETDWTENPYLDILKEYYLLYTRWLEDAIYETPGIDEKIREKAGFWVRQWLNATAPTNFLLTNPIAWKKIIETGGQNLVNGVSNFLEDNRSRTIRMVDMNAFTVGKDIATTAGEVVYRCALFELIQYKPTTEQVHREPLLIIPPWINKFYILDLGGKSMVRYLVNQGFTVFIISWRNPPAHLRYIRLDDYMLSGVLTAINVIKSICQVETVHPVGYCIGGIVLTSLMAWLNKDPTTAGENCPVQHWTVFTTLVDFTNPGEIKIFIDEENVNYIEKLMEENGGFLQGQQLADAFRLLRSNSLIWHYYVHSYLYGENLPAFDVLFWNMDSTRLPAAMHTFYLREFYLNNKLVQKDGVTLGGRALDIQAITQPLYAVAAEQDHIAPWKETFKICAHINSPIRFVLATSGHILGIVSPPVNPPKRRYWVGEATGAQDAEQWREQQNKVAGSWWDDWTQWLKQKNGELQAPPTMGNEQYPPLFPAPGTYVFEK